MRIIKFKKMHGLGNDFVIFDFRGQKDNYISKGQVIKLSDRKLGIGCDQLIILQSSEIADCKMVIFNADGSESGACGNASRCVAKLINELSGTIEVASRVIKFKKEGDYYTLNLGKVEFRWDKIPLSKEMDPLNLYFDKTGFENGIAVNVGNPHLVFFLKDISNIKIAEVGSYFERYSLFPEKINVNFAQILSRNHIRLRVWERGVGETLACGSGAAATVSAAYEKRLVNSKCQVSLPGGVLMIEIDPKNGSEVYMSGPAEEVFEGHLRFNSE